MAVAEDTIANENTPLLREDVGDNNNGTIHRQEAADNNSRDKREEGSSTQVKYIVAAISIGVLWTCRVES